SVVISPQHGQMPAIPLVTGGVAMVEPDSLLKFPSRRDPVPVEGIQAKGKRDMGFAETAVESQGFERGCLGLRISVPWRQNSILPISAQGIGVRQPRIRFRV